MRKEVAKKYSIIYADPPWNFRVWSKKGEGRSPDQHYLTQGLDYLKLMDIQSIANKDSVLLMWATFPCLAQALDLVKSWGFTYKTVAFTWIKENKNNGKLFCGMGYYTRANAEIVLLATRGKPLKRMAKNIRQVLISKLGRHSEKPVEIRRRIVALFGQRSRIELFARDGNSSPSAKDDGWDVFGNEVKGSIKIAMKGGVNVDQCE
ncbi:N6-adenosine-specific RNA methylase IME4 [Pedobacter xixiisoli]|uniref:N6-adenosine-specific RNA methylase IME4 n=2 Tax=Pedobacter xixiisoli TaxID=1476464 RepID=A0A286A764_9SPHI|nr:MT-A70 family methyltransferase [Pedobacter xixiisoli]SOD17661.1 N6-adenosine-specific RNA methylase IME4 [Pedobacter xixiisoli]